MLAKAVDGVPAADSVPGGLAYEPKWDGFRCLVVRDGDEIELASRGSKPLTRYFPEVVEDVRRLLPQKCVIDAEIVVRTGPSGAERLHWENLSARIHPALSRITKLSVEAPAELVCFDLLALGDVSLLDLPFRDRRAWLEKALTGLSQNDPIHLSQVTTDAAVARDWFERFEGRVWTGSSRNRSSSRTRPAGGRCSRSSTTVRRMPSSTATASTSPDRASSRCSSASSPTRTARTSWCRSAGSPRSATPGGSSSSRSWRRSSCATTTATPSTPRRTWSRFSSSKDISFVPVRAERVVEVAFDQMEGRRFRHAVTFLRWRPDREPTSCRLGQVERAPAYDLAEVLATP